MFFTAERIVTHEQMDLSLEIRREVFIEEQGVDPEEEIDDFKDEINVYSNPALDHIMVDIISGESFLK